MRPCVLLLLPFFLSPTGLSRAGGPDFNRDVRPVLSDKCYSCHGPDEKERKAKLRLDQPGWDADEVLARIVSDDPDEVMPPPKVKKPLSAREVSVLQDWVKSGAGYAKHWAFEAPERPSVPDVAADSPVLADGAIVRNAIDAFVFARLAKESWRARPEAERERLLRRVTLDLTGLPPTVAEMDAFLADGSADAYEKVVARLLESPAYGERMALHWLDLARYADTHGYHLDSGREMWPWRDWVMAAFQRNQPFDQFVREQLAGDLMPQAARDQIVATGFIRNNMINFEGGAIAEEYLNAYMVDRVNTFSTVFLGLTMNCAQCHDHKYDPLTMRDFYSLYAYFNAVPERGLDGNRGNAEPVLSVPTAEQEKRVAELEQAIAAGGRKTDDAAWTVLRPVKAGAAGGATLTMQSDGSMLASGTHPAGEVYKVEAEVPAGPIRGIRLETMPDDTLPGGGPGRASNGNFVLAEIEVDGAKFTGAHATYSQKQYEIGRAIDGKAGTGWAVDGNERHAADTAWFACEPYSPAGGRLTVRLRFDTPVVHHAVGRFRLAVTGDAAAASGDGSVASLQQELEALRKSFPTVMVMRQMEIPRDTFILSRGQYDVKGERVSTAVPAVLGRVPENSPSDRRALAAWLTAPEHPLLARVTVNRMWSIFFGRGLVKTVNDFGLQGEFPSHPELLDWLAVEFRESGWDVKRLVTLLVTSHAYRQSAAGLPETLQKDPENRLLARGPRSRLPAEHVRDNALALSGLLHAKVGGPSVFPPQPEGLWEELSKREDSGNWTGQFYTPSEGPDRWRRGLYTFWKRTCPPPSLMTFDAPDREVCTAERAVTSTPLQALVLLNDPVYVEAARVLAQRILREGGGETTGRLAFGFRLCTSRKAGDRELAALQGLLARQLSRFAAAPAEAAKLVSAGVAPRDAPVSDAELAAWTVIASTLLNLDETICN